MELARLEIRQLPGQREQCLENAGGALEIAQPFERRRLSQQGLRMRRAPLQHKGTSSIRKLAIGEPKSTRRDIQMQVDAQLGDPSAELDGRALVVRREPLARVAPSEPLCPPLLLNGIRRDRHLVEWSRPRHGARYGARCLLAQVRREVCRVAQVRRVAQRFGCAVLFAGPRI